MKTEEKIIQDIFGKFAHTFSREDMIKVMRIFSNQFRYVKTTFGKNILFDDLDYNVLRKQEVFFANDRKCVMAVWKSKKGKKTVAPVAKLMIGAEGRSIIHYKDRNPLNLKRDNLELIEHRVAHFKQKKQRTAKR